MQAKRSRGRTPTPGRYQGLRDKRGMCQTYFSCQSSSSSLLHALHCHGRGHRRSRSYSPRRWDGRDRDPHSRDRRGRSRSPHSRPGVDYYDSYRRRRDRSLSADRSHRTATFCPWFLKLDLDSHGSRFGELGEIWTAGIRLKLLNLLACSPPMKAVLAVMVNSGRIQTEYSPRWKSNPWPGMPLRCFDMTGGFLAARKEWELIW
ncbi:hypothetical protein DKX38_000742 [Salix brachista]|uniref:Uncharacterized protein n=1 Tax=Salix brachista TaxID=2182728 RepID=A0A5N5P341_9ROSI|nr:hypothetical protein DKX38_000742 [Salix brachista]